MESHLRGWRELVVQREAVARVDAQLRRARRRDGVQRSVAGSSDVCLAGPPGAARCICMYLAECVGGVVVDDAARAQRREEAAHGAVLRRVPG